MARRDSFTPDTTAQQRLEAQVDREGMFDRAHAMQRLVLITGDVVRDLTNRPGKQHLADQMVDALTPFREEKR